MPAGDVQGAGGVELREDVPLKGGGGSGGGGGGVGAACGAACGGARGVQACFAALSVGITLALLAQVLGGGAVSGGAGGLHGAVSSDAAACSAAGARVLHAAGRALDAAAAAALCLALTTPNATSLDASGSLLLWQYRTEHAGAPILAQWGAARDAPPAATDAPPATEAAAPASPRAPRLLCALAALHAAYGALPWDRVIQPTIDLIAAESPPSAEHTLLADYLRSAQRFTSAETASGASCGWEGAGGGVRVRAAGGARVVRWRAWGAAAHPRVRDALEAAVGPRAAPPGVDPLAALDPLDRAVYRAAERLSIGDAADAAAPPPPVPPASGLAVVDHQDTYVALVTGLSGDGAGASSGAGWRYDEPRQPLDLAPAIFAEDRVCGSRLVVGAESLAALAQGGAALLAGGGALAVERPRLAGAPGALTHEINPRVPPPSEALLRLALPSDAPPSRAAAVNVVLQRGDALASHADSRAGGLASRF